MSLCQSNEFAITMIFCIKKVEVYLDDGTVQVIVKVSLPLVLNERRSKLYHIFSGKAVY